MTDSPRQPWSAVTCHHFEILEGGSARRSLSQNPKAATSRRTPKEEAGCRHPACLQLRTHTRKLLLLLGGLLFGGGGGFAGGRRLAGGGRGLGSRSGAFG